LVSFLTKSPLPASLKKLKEPIGEERKLTRTWDITHLEIRVDQGFKAKT
jgi:hypothetical protein